MKRILVVTYHFPPDGEIGAVRPYELARHLPEFGFVPVVLTVEPTFAESPDPGFQPEGVSADRIVRTVVQSTSRDWVLRAWQAMSAQLRRRVSVSGTGPQPSALDSPKRRPQSVSRRGVLAWLAFPDSRYGWYKPALRAGDALLAKEPCDLVLSTSPPRVAHLVASRLATRHNIPWIMDLRDPWHIAGTSPGTADGGLLARLQGALFKQHAARAALLVVNTEVHREHLERTLGPRVRKTVCVPNGLDASSSTGGDDRRTRFSIGYFGQMSGRRSARAFLEGWRYWLEHRSAGGEDLIACFVGVDFEDTRRLAHVLRLDRVTFSPRVPRQEMAALMAEQYVLLVLANDQPLQIPGKVYEYLTAGRRILACTERDSATARLLGRAEGCQVAETPEEVANALERWSREYSAGAGALVERRALLASMTHRHRAEQFAKLLGETA